MKFVSQGHLGIKSPLEALLAGMPDLEIDVPSVMEDKNDGSGISDQCNLTLVEDSGAIASGADTTFQWDMDHHSLYETPSKMEADELHDCYTSSGQKMSASILIWEWAVSADSRGSAVYKY